jgi:hypothetical protein
MSNRQAEPSATRALWLRPLCAGSRFQRGEELFAGGSPTLTGFANTLLTGVLAAASPVVQLPADALVLDGPPVRMPQGPGGTR